MNGFSPLMFSSRFLTEKPHYRFVKHIEWMAASFPGLQSPWLSLFGSMKIKVNGDRLNQASGNEKELKKKIKKDLAWSIKAIKWS